MTKNLISSQQIPIQRLPMTEGEEDPMQAGELIPIYTFYDPYDVKICVQFNFKFSCESFLFPLQTEH